MNQDRPIVLASRSPRRVELLQAAGIDFTIDPADIDEESITHNARISPRELAILLATEKARAVALRHPEAWVIGADTVVAVGAELFGKADDNHAARAMLMRLFDTEQSVITGVAVACQRSEATPPDEQNDSRTQTGPRRRADPRGQSDTLIRSDAAESIVRMRAMSPADLDAYIESNDWRGKAGAYGIQDDTLDPFVTLISGGFDNVVGLPVDLTLRLLRESGSLGPA